jgi:uncharacterized protein (UPF0332 family)
MRWSEFLDTAKHLITRTTEGDWRSAVSRSYYAIFHFFREWLLGEGINIGKGAQAHNSLYVGLWNTGIPAISPVGNRIDNLRDARNDCDYELSARVTQIDASDLVNEAQSIITDFQAAISAIGPSMVAQAVRRHLVSIGRLPKTP